jgi:hypothetical protein
MTIQKFPVTAKNFLLGMKESWDAILKARTLAEFQAIVRAPKEAEPNVSVMVEEVFSDSSTDEEQWTRLGF